MIYNFFNNLFNDKNLPSKPSPKPKSKSGNKKKSSNTEGGKKKTSLSTLTSWTINDVQIPVEIHREKRRGARVSFGKDKLIFRASVSYNQTDFLKAMQELKDAITQKIQKKPQLLSRFLQRHYKNGDALQVGDKTYYIQIELEDKKSHSGKLGKNGAIHLRLSSADTEGGHQKVIPTLLSRIISKDCAPAFSRRVLEFNHLYFKKNIKSINFKYNHSNWGSCSSSGNLNFSTRLLFAPEAVQDYVIIHELAHLIELNHSDRFWKLVSDAMRDYTEKEKWLKEHGHGCRF